MSGPDANIGDPLRGNGKMTTRQKIELRQSAVRTRLREIADTEELTDELRAEMETLKTEMADLELRFQAAVTAEDEQRQAVEETGEGAEIRRLSDRAMLGNYLGAIIDDREPEGVEKELAEARELSGNVIPWDALVIADREPEARALETRVDAATNLAGAWRGDPGRNPAACVQPDGLGVPGREHGKRRDRRPFLSSVHGRRDGFDRGESSGEGCGGGGDSDNDARTEANFGAVCVRSGRCGAGGRVGANATGRPFRRARSGGSTRRISTGPESLRMSRDSSLR